VSPGAGHRGRLLAVLLVLAGFAVLEVVAAWWTGSLALLSDGGHMFSDVLGIGMSLAAIQAATVVGVGQQRTFGLYRLEVLAALGNALLLFGVAGYILFEGVRRLPQPPEVLSGPMLAVALAGLAANLVAFGLLRRDAADNLNVRGAYLEVLADTVASIGVIAAAATIAITGWRYADPIVAVAAACFMLPRTWKLAASAVRILVQAAPEHLDVSGIRDALLEVPEVTEVHDLHVWTLTSGMEVASAHLTVTTSADTGRVLAAARTALRDSYRIDHATLQVEPAGAVGCCQSVGW
jgi:cobalt-zinc-cadmium efflux system protein